MDMHSSGVNELFDPDNKGKVRFNPDFTFDTDTQLRLDDACTAISLKPLLVKYKWNVPQAEKEHTISK